MNLVSSDHDHFFRSELYVRTHDPHLKINHSHYLTRVIEYDPESLLLIFTINVRKEKNYSGYDMY